MLKVAENSYMRWCHILRFQNTYFSERTSSMNIVYKICSNRSLGGPSLVRSNFPSHYFPRLFNTIYIDIHCGVICHIYRSLVYSRSPSYLILFIVTPAVASIGRFYSPHPSILQFHSFHRGLNFAGC